MIEGGGEREIDPHVRFAPFRQEAVGRNSVNATLSIDASCFDPAILLLGLASML